MVGNDAAIMDAVATRIAGMGNSVEKISEAALADVADLNAYDCVFCMGRSAEALKLLSRVAGQCVIVNSPEGIGRCNHRSDLVSLFIDGGIPIPPTMILTTDGSKSDGEMQFPVWIKRGDSCAQVREDVTYVATPDDAPAVLDAFQQRGIRSLVIQQHVAGDLIKFYGVEGTDFFHWYYASAGHSKFGLEAINGAEQGFAFDPKRLKAIADEAACIADVRVYGGDCVVTAQGEIKIIDFNDWPSFSCCRDAAADAIAQTV